MLLAGLPWTAWLLWLAAVGGGLGLALRFYRRYRHLLAEEDARD